MTSEIVNMPAWYAARLVTRWLPIYLDDLSLPLDFVDYRREVSLADLRIALP
jgi:hypothetical protein